MPSLAVNQGRAYTQGEMDRMAEMFNAGKSLEEMALELGRTGSGIAGKLVSMGILYTFGDGHYYPVSSAWAMWQEVKAVDNKMKGIEP